MPTAACSRASKCSYLKKTRLTSAIKHEATWTQYYPVASETICSVQKPQNQDPTFKLFTLSVPSSLSLWFHWFKLE
jgi:hypothetical protein